MPPGDVSPGDDLRIEDTTLPEATMGRPYATCLHREGVAETTGWMVLSGTLPEGLELSDTGRLDGTPEGPPGRRSFKVGASDGRGRRADREFRLEVLPASVALVRAVLVDVDKDRRAGAGDVVRLEFDGVVRIRRPETNGISITGAAHSLGRMASLRQGPHDLCAEVVLGSGAAISFRDGLPEVHLLEPALVDLSGSPVRDLRAPLQAPALQGRGWRWFAGEDVGTVPLVAVDPGPPIDSIEGLPEGMWLEDGSLRGTPREPSHGWRTLTVRSRQGPPTAISFEVASGPPCSPGFRFSRISPGTIGSGGSIRVDFENDLPGDVRLWLGPVELEEQIRLAPRSILAVVPDEAESGDLVAFSEDARTQRLPVIVTGHR